MKIDDDDISGIITIHYDANTHCGIYYKKSTGPIDLDIYIIIICNNKRICIAIAYLGPLLSRCGIEM